jgi:hypothetical protein
MAWRISEDELLIRGRRYPIALSLSVNRVRLPDGALVDSANEFFRVTPSGDVLEWFGGPWTTTLEEFLTVSAIHCVVDSTLFSCVWKERFGHPGTLEACVRLGGLEPVSDDELAFVAVHVVDEFHRRRAGAT